MNEEPLENPNPGREPVEQDVGQRTEEMSDGAENTSVGTPAQEPTAPAGSVNAEESPSSDPVQKPPKEVKEEAKSPTGEPPVDWFEPLEDDEEEEDDDDDDDEDDEDDYDDTHSIGRNDPEEESLAGESERSESLAGSEKAFKKIYHLKVTRRKRSHPDEGWVNWSILGDGWKRKEVVRRSGSSVGQKDVYYMSPRGDRVRSRVELISVLEGYQDLSTFDYKSGKFYDGVTPPIRVRSRAKRKLRERSSSESSWMERGEGADTPDSSHRLTPSQGLKHVYYYNQTSFSSYNSMEPLNHSSRHEDLTNLTNQSNQPMEDKIRLPLPSSSRVLPLPSINGEIASEDNTLICAKCGISFTGTWYDKQRKRPCCPACWASKTKEHPLIRFRKWIPCGQCVGCHNTVNCGLCANCKHGLQSPESRKRICRKRKCICPIRKGPESGSLLHQRVYNDTPDAFDDSKSFQSEVTDSQHPSLKSSDTENFSVNVDVDDEDDMSTDDDDDWHKKRKRRSCGECKACLCRKDCGTCDFCIDKPKFGGSNKKRQKCRLRQCQRQAMRHLLPFQMGQVDCGPDGTMLPGRPRPHYTYSRKSNFKRNRQFYLDFTDNEDEDINVPSMNADGSKRAYDLNARNHQSTMQVRKEIRLSTCFCCPTLVSFKHNINLIQVLFQHLNHLDFAQRNGLSERVPHISNHNTELDQLRRWHTEKSYTGRDGQKLVEEDEDDGDELPMITQIFSLADTVAGIGVDAENQLMKLLHGLRSSALPILWYAIIVEGPQLQLIQCSKQSNMTDTMVLIDPGFCYQVTVQKQPLIPTHTLYDKYPGRLTSVTEVVNLLLGLEKYVVCQGLPPKEPSSDKDPIIVERASTCDFLVKKKVSVCANCRALQGF